MNTHCVYVCLYKHAHCTMYIHAHSVYILISSPLKNMYQYNIQHRHNYTSYIILLIQFTVQLVHACSCDIIISKPCKRVLPGASCHWLNGYDTIISQRYTVAVTCDKDVGMGLCMLRHAIPTLVFLLFGTPSLHLFKFF